MINSQGTSFIPQRPTKGKVNTRRVRKIYVLTYISYVLFFGAVLAAAGTFFFNIVVERQLESVKQSLSAEREKFSQADIESVRELDKKMKMATERLGNHISVVSIFDALERSAVQSLRFIEFSYKRLNDEAPVVVLKGTTARFDSVIFQRDVLLANSVLANSKIKEVTLESIDTSEGEGTPQPEDIQQVITFELSNEIDPALIGYQPRVGNAETFEQNEEQAFDEQDAEQTANETDDSGSSDEFDSESVPEEGGQDDVINQNQ